MELTFIIAIATLVLRYGIPATINILRAWRVDNPTLEDIEALKNRVPPPKSYFEKKEEN